MNTVGPWRPESSKGSKGRHWGPIFRRNHSASNDETLESPIVLSRLRRRVHLAEGFVILMVTLLLLGFWRLQVVHAEHYRELADNNRHQSIIVRAPRGLVTDRKGSLLAANRPAFNVAIVREELDDRDATLQWLADVLNVTPAMLHKRLDQRQQGIPVFQPIVIAGDIAPSLVPAIEARSFEYPGVLIQPEHKRHYPKGTVAAHVMGYVGEINAVQLAAWEQDRYRMGDIVGQLGLERVHDSLLSGFAGAEEIIVNSAGRTIRVLNQIPPEPGNTLTLTLDARLQEQAEALLEGKKGAIVMLDVNTGGTLALASAPTFDPNMFARRFSQAEWNAVTNDPATPLQNRALQSAYPPGSIFKLLVAVAGLEAGRIRPETTVTCTGGGMYYGQYRSCNAIHGRVNLESAIGRSCNVYFYELGAKLSREQIIEVAQRYGLGAQTGIDLLNEATGILPTKEWIAQALPPRDGNWYLGETIGLSIGQGPITTTPLQLAHMVATLATGLKMKPYLIEKVESSTGNSRSRHVPHDQAIEVDLRPDHREALLAGMRAALKPVTGTGRRAANPNYDFGGKTGTAQVASAVAAGPEEERPEGLRNHAWFVGIAPVEKPEIAIVVFIEHGVGGGVAAAPVAGQLMTTYFEATEETKR